MSDQRLLIDNDAFILLAGTDLLSEALTVLGYEPAAALRLHPLPYMLSKQKSIQARYPPDVITKARATCDQIPALEQREGNAEIFGRLIAAHDDINDGEALLLTVAVEQPNYAVLTGDRRALCAFGQSQDLADLRESLAGRVLCMEVVLRLLAERLGVDALCAKLAPMIPLHQSLKIFFSAENQANHSQCIAALKSYLQDLRKLVGPALLLNPFDDSTAPAGSEPDGS